MTDAKILLSLDNGERLDYVQDVVDGLQKVQLGRDGDLGPKALGKLAGNWGLHELGSLLTTSETAWEANSVFSISLAQLLDHLLTNRITGSSAKLVLRRIFEGDTREISRIIQEDGFLFRPLSDKEYEQLARDVMESNADIVQQIRSGGKTGKLMYLVGQMMRRGEEGRIEAKEAERVMRRLALEEEPGQRQ